MDKRIFYILAELFRYKTVPKDKTEKFEKLKHNDDLCPRFEKQGHRVLNCFLKYKSIVYDIQGIHDRGTDVLFRFSIEIERGVNEDFFAAVQIKSFDDLKSDTYLKDLRSQAFEAINEFKDYLDQYYIFLCTNPEEHQNKIRQVKAAFRAANNITVIDPGYAYNFLSLSNMRINSVVSTFLREDDLVYEKAGYEIEPLTPTEAAAYLTLVYINTFEQGSILKHSKIFENEFLREQYYKIPDYDKEYYDSVKDEFESLGSDSRETNTLKPIDRKRDPYERFSEDMSTLEGGYISIDVASGIINVHQKYARAIQAVMFDGAVRYDYENDDIIRYVYKALEVCERYQIDDIEYDDLWVYQSI